MMKTWKTACALSSAVCLLVVTQAMGQLTQPRNPGQGALERGAAQREATGQKFNLASKLTKMNVKDSANQTIGQIQDLLIDETGQVQYVAIAVQGAAADRLQPRTPGARSDQPAVRPEQPGARPEQPSARLQPGAREEVADARMSKITLVPFESVEFHDGATAAQAYVMLSIDKDRFTQAPTFTVQQITAQGGQATWMTQVDQFFERDKSGAARPDLNRPNPNNRDPRSPRTPNRTTPDREDDNRGTPDREDDSVPRIPKPERDE
jgi:sporulation protein YlmC with PRC-barrel domain